MLVSIHAPTRGATKNTADINLEKASFNSRTHAGCDERVVNSICRSLVSIHAPTRGATKR